MYGSEAGKRALYKGATLPCDKLSNLACRQILVKQKSDQPLHHNVISESQENQYLIMVPVYRARPSLSICKFDHASMLENASMAELCVSQSYVFLWYTSKLKILQI